MADLLRYEELPEIRWHGWKKLGAALFVLLGGVLSSLQRWGRWHSLHQPRRYSRAPPAWKLPDRVQLPYPVATTNSPVRDMEWRLVRLPDLWPCDTFAKPCTGPVRAPQQLELACAAACQPSSTGRASSESRSSGESTDTDRSDVPSQCSESVTMAESESVATPAAASGAVDTGFAQDSRADESVATRSTAAALGSAGVGSAPSTMGAPCLPPPQVPTGVCDGGSSRLVGPAVAVRPASPLPAPAAKRPMYGTGPSADTTPFHGYELTAPRRGDSYAHWRPLWLREVAPEPVRSVSPPHTSSPMHGCGEAGAPPASVPDDSDYVVAGFDSPHGQPPPHAIPRQANTAPPPPPQQVPQHCPTPPSSPLEPVHQLLHQLAADPSILSDTSPTSTRATTDVSPTEGTPSQSSVTPEMVQRGLGTAGHVEIPSSLWQSCAPANFQWADDHAPQQRASQDPILLMLASKLAESGLLCELPPHFLPNAKAYLKPKSAQKCAMIVNMIPINDHCLPPPPFSLFPIWMPWLTLSLLRCCAVSRCSSPNLTLVTCFGRAKCLLSRGMQCALECVAKYFRSLVCLLDGKPALPLHRSCWLCTFSIFTLVRPLWSYIWMIYWLSVL